MYSFYKPWDKIKCIKYVTATKQYKPFQKKFKTKESYVTELNRNSISEMKSVSTRISSRLTMHL